MKKLIRALIVISLLTMIFTIPLVHALDPQAIGFSNLSPGQDISGIYLLKGRTISEEPISKIAVKVGAGPWVEAAGIEQWQYQLDTRQIYLGTHYRFDSAAGRLIQTSRYGPYYGELQIKAAAFDAQDLLVAEKTIEVNVIPEKPTFDLFSGIYNDDALSVAIKKAPEVEVYYTTDGRNPVQSGQLYSQPITVTQDTVLKAVAKSDNGIYSGLEQINLKFDRESPLTLMIQYYYDQSLIKPIPDPAYLKPGTYYLKVVSNQKLASPPQITINTPGGVNQVHAAEMARVSDYVYRYTRVVEEDPTDSGETQEEIRIDGIDHSGQSFELQPSNASAKAAYLDTLPPSAGTIQLVGESSTTNDPTPIFSIKSDGAAQMRLALAEAELAKAPWVEYSERYDGFDLSRGGKGPKTVWIEFMDQAGNIQTEHASTDVHYDDSILAFDLEYFADADLAVSLGDDPHLKAGTYYLKLTANQDLYSTPAPTIQIDAEGEGNDLANAAMTRINSRTFSYLREILPDPAAVGANKEVITIHLNNQPYFPSNPDKAAYIDTLAPEAPTVIGPAETEDPRPTWTWHLIDDAVRYRYSFTDGVDWIETTALSFSLEADLAVNNSYTLYVQAGDKAGNWSASGSFTVFVCGIPAISVAQGSTIIENTAGVYDFGIVFISDSTEATFTINNDGTGDLRLTGDPVVAVEGANASDFAVIHLPDPVLAPGGSTFFTVEFTPGGNGLKTALISITNNDTAQSPFTFILRGEGKVKPKPAIEVTEGASMISPGGISNFGLIRVPFSAEKTFTITNTGTELLKLTGTQGIKIEGDDASAFKVTQPEDTNLPPQGSTTFTVEFTPPGDGVKTATLNIANNSAQTPYTFTLTGEGVTDKPAIEVSQETTVLPNDGSFPFGSVFLSSYVDQTFTIKNTGTANLTLNGYPQVMIGGEHKDEFSVLTQPVINIAPGDSTTFTTRFTPEAAGARNAYIQIQTNVAAIGYYFNLQITGTGATQPVMEIYQGTSPIPHEGSYSTVVPLLSTGDTVFTLKNSGSAALELTGDPVVKIEGADAACFSVVTLPETVIEPDAETSFTLSYTPGGSENETAVITINNSSNQDPYTFTLNGSGKIQETLDGDDQVTSNISAGQVLTYALDIGATSAALIWQDRYDRANSSYNGDIQVSAYRADLSMIFEDVDSGYSTPQWVSSPYGDLIYIKVVGVISGSFRLETRPWESEMHLYQGETAISDEGYYEFGEVPLFESRAVTFTIKNTGAKYLELTGQPKVRISGPDASCFTVTTQPNKATVPFNGSLTFTIQFTPNSVGDKTAYVSIANDDSDKNPYTFQLYGAGDDNVIRLYLSGWRTGYEMRAGEVFVFSITTTPGEEYLIAWDDKRYGSGDYSCDVMVSAYREDLNTSYFINIDNGYLAPQIITAEDKIVYLKVTGATPSELGSFAMRAAVNKPIMRINRGGTTIKNGTGSHDFGEYPVHSEVDTIFTIENNGGQALTLTGTPFVEIIGEDAEHFSIVRQPYSPVSAERKIEFTLRYNPLAAGTKNATVRIANDDPENNPYTFTVTGSATFEPEIIQLDKWKPGIITRDGEAKLYAFNTEPGKIYAVQWDDVYDGSQYGYYDLDAVVTAYRKDLTTPYPELTNVNHGYTTFPTFTALDDLVYLKVLRRPQLSEGGLFAIKPFWHESIIEVGQGENMIPLDGIYDFGDVIVDETKAVRFTITNTGCLDLHSISVQIFGTTDFPDVSCFKKTDDGPSVINPGGSSDFVVEFTPDSMGTKAVNVEIISNDEDRNPYRFTFTGNGIAPLINVQQGTEDITPGGTFNFGDVPIYSSKNITFTIQNVGTSPLTLTDDPPIRLGEEHISSFCILTQPDATVLAPGEETNFTIRFSPLGEETKTTPVYFSNNDKYAGFSITGTGTAQEMQEIELDTWTPDQLAVYGEVKYYVFPTTPGELYYVAWDDNGEGSGAYTGDITVIGIREGLRGGYFGCSESYPDYNPDLLGLSAPDSGYHAPYGVLSKDNAAVLRVVCKTPGSYGLKVATTAPEIRIVEKGQEEDIYMLHYGFVAIGSKKSIVLDVRNEGDTVLNITAVELENDYEGNFRIVTTPDPVIEAKGKDDFIIQFIPQTLWEKTANLMISSDDDDHNPYSIFMEGIAVNEVKEIKAADFGSLIEGNLPTSGYDLVYQVPVAPGRTYTITWLDALSGSGSYTCDIQVSAYKMDAKTTYFDAIDNGQLTPQVITAQEEIIYLRIGTYGLSDPGSFAIKVEEEE